MYDRSSVHFSTVTQAFNFKKEAQFVQVAIRFRPPIVVKQF